MADGTIRGESCRLMIRVGCSIVILLVTGCARARGSCILSVQMALFALQGGVFAGKRVPGVCKVVEFCVQPVGRGMADRAIMRQGRLHVAGVFCANEIGLVTAVAVLRSAGIHVVDVAFQARRSLMRPGEGKARL